MNYGARRPRAVLKRSETLGYPRIVYSVTDSPCGIEATKYVLRTVALQVEFAGHRQTVGRFYDGHFGEFNGQFALSLGGKLCHISQSAMRLGMLSLVPPEGLSNRGLASVS